MDLSFNNFYGNLSITEKYDLLEHIDMSHNQLTDFTINTHAASLQYIDVSHNQIARNIKTANMFSIDGEGGDIFIDYIDLSYNYFYFGNNQSGINFQQYFTWDFNLFDKQTITYLNLEHNLISTNVSYIESMINENNLLNRTGICASDARNCVVYAKFDDMPDDMTYILDSSVQCGNTSEYQCLTPLDRTSDECEGRISCFATCRCANYSVEPSTTDGGGVDNTGSDLNSTMIIGSVPGPGTESEEEDASTIVLPDSSFLGSVSNSTFTLIVLIISVILLVVAVFSYGHKKSPHVPLFLKCFSPVDNGKPFSLIVFVFQIYDFLSDINFVIFLNHVWHKNESYNDKNGNVLQLYFIFCLIFVLLPWIVNLFFVFYMRYFVWNVNNIVNAWLRKYSGLLIIFTIVSGMLCELFDCLPFWKCLFHIFLLFSFF